MFGDDDSFWTRDDINELVSEIEDSKQLIQFLTINRIMMRINGSYIENDNTIELDVELIRDNIEVWETFRQKIDMRKITSPNCLVEKYAPLLVEQMMDYCKGEIL